MHRQFSLMNYSLNRWLAVWLVMASFSAPLCAQQAATPPRQPSPDAEITFDTLLAVDAYKMYGEARNVGQLLSTGGAGEIIDPIVKLADPGPEFKAIISFLKKNSEALSSSRLMFATWPAHTDLPTTLVAIEFPTNDEATKFTPKLEKFLPTVLPPVPVAEPTPSNSPAATRTESPQAQ